MNRAPFDVMTLALVGAFPASAGLILSETSLDFLTTFPEVSPRQMSHRASVAFRSGKWRLGLLSESSWSRGDVKHAETD